MASPQHFTDASAHLRVDGISASFGERRVLTDVSFVVPAGSRTALLGENGTGKTTLLHIIAGELAADGGTVQVFCPGGSDARIGLLRQDASVPTGTTVHSVLESAVSHIRDAQRLVETTGDLLADDPDGTAASAFAAAIESAERLDAWNIDARITHMLAGLGLGHVDTADDAGALSGGQQSRLALAALLLSTPDILLLDEPTNHLDDAAAAHLVLELSGWRAPVLFTSHDRVFVDETATALVDLDPAPLLHTQTSGLVQDGAGAGIGVTRFTGTYTDYLQARRDARQRWEQQFAEEQTKLKKLRASVSDSQTVGHVERGPRTEARASKKFYADRNAKVVSRRVGDARSRLEELEATQIRKPPGELSFAGIPSIRGSATDKTLLTATGVSIPGRLPETSLSIRRGEQWLITGENGMGKSTLLALLAGALEPVTGAVHTGSGVRVGMLSQQAELPDPKGRGSERSVLQAYEDAVGDDRATDVPLAQFGLFAPRDLNRPLSSGCLRRAI